MSFVAHMFTDGRLKKDSLTGAGVHMKYFSKNVTIIWLCLTFCPFYMIPLLLQIL